MIAQRQKANELLAVSGTQIAITLIEPEFKKYFKPSEKDETQGLGDNIDLRVAIDILEYPDRYMSGASEEKKAKRFNLGNRDVPMAKNPAYPTVNMVPSFACSANTDQPQQQAPT